MCLMGDGMAMEIDKVTPCFKEHKVVFGINYSVAESAFHILSI